MWTAVGMGLFRRAEEIDPTTHRPKDAARYYGINDEVRGSNDGLLWMDPRDAV